MYKKVVIKSKLVVFRSRYKKKTEGFVRWTMLHVFFLFFSLQNENVGGTPDSCIKV